MKLFLLAAIGLSAVARAQLGAPADSDTPRRAAEAFLAGGSISTRSAPASATTQDAAAIKAAVLAGKYTSRLNEATRKRCPLSCSSTGANSSHWFAYQSVDRLDICNETMLVDFSLLSELNNPHSSNKIFACTADFGGIAGTEPATAATCHVGGVNYTEDTLPLQMVSSGVSSSVGLTFVSDALTQLRKTFKLAGPSCNETIRYAYSEKAAIGIYIGSRLNNQDVIDSVLDQLTTTLQDNGAVSESLAVQLCDNRSARYSLGVFISTLPSLSAAQNAVQTWKNGSCLASMSTTSPAWHNITFNAPEVSHSHKNSSSLLNRAAHSSQLSARATCRTIQVQGGDSCSSLATECGITTAQFAEYNPASNDCSKYPLGENVCCSSGSLPDYLPKLDSQGNCLSHTIAAGDLCSTLAASLNITTDDIEEWNKDTWGWEGCNKLFIGDLMCLSAGYPPMPAPIANAVCGPQVNNTATAPPGTDLTQLNECPLNACCNIWGQCGTTADFCTVSNSSTGAPGTAAPGVNGCISNCGTDIISSSAPSEQFKIAYWEGFSWQRPCLNAGLQHLNTSAYTHVHFGFAGINPDWTINMSTIDPEFPFFQDLRGVKKILSFGGWAFSTDPSTYMIFRNAVASESSRSALVSNIVNFVNDNDLDGVDIDWEYPDEPDIPGIPAGTDDDSTGLFLLLDELKQSFALLAFGKTISITAPASYWYLQHFPIMALSTVVDYIVYMTYDLHGQWDYGRAYSDTGCPAGDCLRSHVNMTETVNALSMITKAGVASNKVVVGVSSYARSFGMITPGCWTEMCPYMGPDSGALAGPCTNTAGYLANYELNLVITENPTAEQYWDQDSYSNILVYNNTQWAAYMNDTNKQTREVIYGALSFLGSSDWAVDLQVEFGSDSGSSSSGSSGSGDNIVYIDPGIWSSASAEITALPGVTLIWPPKPLATPTTITFPPWTTTVSYSYLTTLTSTLSNGATSTYPWYYYVPIPTVITIPPVTTTEIPIWGVSLDSSSTNGVIYLTSSVQPEPFPVTVTPVINATTSIISATATSTSLGGVFIWGDQTEVLPPETETIGGTTTIIGGITLSPKTITVTPNPHPTQTQTTKDPELNTRTTSWKSGDTPGPTSTPGCDGCGKTCELFCDPDCPFCPPGVFGNPDGDGGDDGDDDDNTSTTTTTETAIATVLEEVVSGDAFPTGVLASSDVASLGSLMISMWNTENPGDPFGVTTTTTTTTTQAPPSSTSTAPPPPPTPTADCYFWDEDFVAFQFEIFNIAGWSTDGGAALHKQEDGCGALTFWTWNDATSTDAAYVYFDLPVVLKAGCVERAVKSAGGPSLSCQGQGDEFPVRKRSPNSNSSIAAAPPVPPLTSQKLRTLQIVYGNNTDRSYKYTPQDWTKPDPS